MFVADDMIRQSRCITYADRILCDLLAILVASSLLQVVVAVLLDNFTAASDKEKEKMESDILFATGPHPDTRALDVIMTSLVQIDSTEELLQRIRHLYRLVHRLAVCDGNADPPPGGHGSAGHQIETGVDSTRMARLTREQVKRGFELLPILPPIRLSEDDLDDFFWKSHHDMGCDDFVMAVERQVRLYIQRDLQNAIQVEDTGPILSLLEVRVACAREHARMLSLTYMDGHIYMHAGFETATGAEQRPKYGASQHRAQRHATG